MTLVPRLAGGGALAHGGRGMAAGSKGQRAHKSMYLEVLQQPGNCVDWVSLEATQTSNECADRAAHCGRGYQQHHQPS